MPLTLLLVRHATHDRPGPRLVGRDDGVGLSPEGREEARRLGDFLSRHRLGAVLTSPSRRCRATAETIAAPHGLRPEVDRDLDEIDFSAWRGRPFADLDGDPDWQLFNTARSRARIPGGETMVAIQARVERALDRIRDRHHGQPVALISHGDIIRTAVCHVLGLTTDHMLRFEVAAGSVSTVELGRGVTTAPRPQLAAGSLARPAGLSARPTRS